jgi:hypothetical protein
MIEPAARGAWRELEAKLRPFVARRVLLGARPEGLHLVEHLGDAIRPTSLRLLRVLPISLVLFVLSRTSLVTTIGVIGPREPGALIGAMIAEAGELSLPALRAIQP